jgi:hypothetical protein
LFLLIFSTGSNIETVELINNGDFEGSAEKWREQIESWQRRDGKEAAVSDQYSHSGRFSLRTSNLKTNFKFLDLSTKYTGISKRKDDIGNRFLGQDFL